MKIDPTTYDDTPRESDSSSAWHERPITDLDCRMESDRRRGE